MAKSAMRKSTEFEQYYQALGNRPETKIFETMKDVFMFAATLGFRQDKRLPFAKAGGEDISLRFFRDEDMSIFDIIALSVTQEMYMLLSDDEYRDKKLALIEEFANGGMSIMIDEFCKPDINERAFRRFIESFEDASGTQPKASLEDILAKAIESV